jgi:hypothetical protein
VISRGKSLGMAAAPEVDVGGQTMGRKMRRRLIAAKQEWPS